MDHCSRLIGYISTMLIASLTSKIIAMHSWIITVFSPVNIKQNYILRVSPLLLS